MAISKDNIFVQLKYKLYVGNDGEEVMIEETPDDQLFRFTTGLGMVLSKFEEALYGKEQGGSFDFYINTEDAYGDSPSIGMSRSDMPMEVRQTPEKLQKFEYFWNQGMKK